MFLCVRCFWSHSCHVQLELKTSIKGKWSQIRFQNVQRRNPTALITINAWTIAAFRLILVVNVLMFTCGQKKHLESISLIVHMSAVMLHALSSPHTDSLQEFWTNRLNRSRHGRAKRCGNLSQDGEKYLHFQRSSTWQTMFQLLLVLHVRRVCVYLFMLPLKKISSACEQYGRFGTSIFTFEVLAVEDLVPSSRPLQETKRTRWGYFQSFIDLFSQ